MQTPDLNDFENRLRASLMPPALSRNATDSIHAMLDELAAVCPPPATRPANRRFPRSLAAIAAVLLAAAIVHGVITPPADVPASTPLAGTPDAAGTAAFEAYEATDDRLVLVDESTRLEWVEDEGWLAAPDGGTMRAVRMQVIEENRIFDEESGIMVSISEPREETVLMPVSTF